MIEPWQIRSAREALRWSQGQLAKRAGTTQPYISRLEKDEIERPSAKIMQDLEKAFETEGIYFSANGFEWRNSSSYSIEGENWWLRVVEDVLNTLQDQKEQECIFVCSDDRKSPPAVNAKYRELRNAGIKFRQLIEEGNSFLMGPLEEYRYIPKENFLNNVTLIYGDKVAICAEDNIKALIVKDQALSKSWRNLIGLLWSKLDQPFESTADEKF